MHDKMSLHETPGSNLRVLMPVVSSCSKHRKSVSDAALAASGQIQTYGYKKLLRIAAVKQTVYGSLGHLKVYPSILNSIPGHKKLCCCSKIYTLPGQSQRGFNGFFNLFACFFKQVSFKSSFIATDGESHYRTPEVSSVLC